MAEAPVHAPLRGSLLSLLAFAIFSSHDALIKALGLAYSPFQIIFFSVLFGFPAVAVAMSVEGALENFRPHKPKLLLARTVAIVLIMASAFYAFTVLPLAEVYAILFATPLLITLLSIPVLGEVVRARRMIATLVGLAGVLIVLRPGSAELGLGHLAALAAAFLSAVNAMILRKIGGEERVEVLVLYPLLANLLAMGVALPFVYKPMPLDHLAFCAAIGLFAFAGQMVSIAAYKVASPSLVAPMQYSQIIWATMFGVLFFGEFPDRWVIIGAGVIIASGVYIVARETKTDISERQPVLRTRNLRFDTGPSPKPRFGRRRVFRDRSS